MDIVQNKKINCVLIGGGVIASSYYHALKTSDLFCLKALCDRNENCYSRVLYKDVPFYG
ncbi:hypothetical protein SAMN02910456_01228 [Ruminococcaceae bacterium YRB3002]|nr:hypothetical protein SAMN02910456_01228 [Ruminococcaceae bacterium YRB3002]